MKGFFILLVFFHWMYSVFSQQKIDTTRYVGDSLKVALVYDAYLIDSILDYGSAYIGKPHCMGGTGENCLDCSGFMFKILKKYGIELGRDSEQMAYYGRMIKPLDSLRRGDLVFFTNSYKTSKFVTHVGMYTENGHFIHASAAKGVEVIDFVHSAYWSSRYVFSKRIFK